MNESLENKTEIKEKPVILMLLRQALDDKDKQLLRTIINGIHRLVDDTDKMISTDMTDSELDVLMKTGEGAIYVGTGTSGQRIYIKNNELYMPRSDETSQMYGKKYQDNFRKVFNIPPEAGELRLSF